MCGFDLMCYSGIKHTRAQDKRGLHSAPTRCLISARSRPKVSKYFLFLKFCDCSQFVVRICSAEAPTCHEK